MRYFDYGYDGDERAITRQFAAAVARVVEAS
jgi:hypothetical protein